MRRGAHANGYACEHDKSGRGSAYQTEAARRLIGLTLLVLVIAIVVMSFAALLTIESQLHAANRAVIAAVRDHGDPQRLLAVAQLASAQSKADGDRLTGLITIVFGPVVALLGSVTGFYFGSRRG